jgi:transposase-like protein
MEALIQRKDASHGGTEEVPRRAAGAGHAHGRGGRRDPATRAGALARVAKQLSINPETLRNWVTQAEIDGGVRPGTTTRDAQRLLELERENRELRRANEIPKTASAFSPRRSSTADCSDRRLHRRTQRTTLRGRAGWGGAGGRRRQIDPSTYYATKTRPPSVRSISDAAITARIDRVHADDCGVYGARNVHAELRGTTGARQRPGYPAGPGRSRVHRDRATLPVGRRHHLLPDPRRLGVRHLRHRRARPLVVGWRLSRSCVPIWPSTYINWFNHRRPHGEIGLVPPAEYEDTHYRHNSAHTLRSVSSKPPPNSARDTVSTPARSRRQ